MKRIIPLLRHLMKPAMAIGLTCWLASPLLADEVAGEMKLDKAREALTGEPKDTVQAKKLLLDIVEHDKDTLDSPSLCYVYVYLGYIEDRAGNRNEAIPWYQKALELKDTDRVRECAEYGLEKPLTWIRHLDEATTPPPGTTAGKISLATAPPVVVKTVPVAGATDVDPALAEIRVSYSKTMQGGSWSWSTWGEENYPETAGNPRYLSDGRTCVLPVNLKPGRFYAIWLNSEKFRNFRDASGKPAVPYLLTFSTKTQSGQVPASRGNGPHDAGFTSLLNEDQQAVLIWTDRQFRGFFDERSFPGWSKKDRTALERKLIDSLKGPRSQEYYQAINTLAALYSTKALPALREIAFDRAEKDNRDRWMATRALGIIGDKASVPEMIHLLYHFNNNTRWWAQISLVRLTGTNFGRDWNAWGKWWNDQNGRPPFRPEIIRWWSQQPDTGKLAASLEESEGQWLNSIRDETQNGNPPSQQQQPSAANSRQQSLHERYLKRTTQDQGKYTPQQLQDAEQLYQVANQKWGAPEAIESLRTMIKEYPDINRAGCATLYLAQMSEGDERTRYLQDCIEKYDDCFYGDGVQVGAYARFLLADDYRNKGKTEMAEALLNEIKTKCADAMDHNGNRLLESSEEDYISRQAKSAEAGNRWAQFNLWDAYYHGTHQVNKDRTKADQWLNQFVKSVFVVRFEPANGFNPQNAMDYLNDIRAHTPQVKSAPNRIGTGSFFRTKKTGGKLAASFLTEDPAELKADIESNPDLKFISTEPMTPQSFVEYEESPQESL